MILEAARQLALYFDGRLEAFDLPLPVGSLCRITSTGGKTSTAEVIGFQAERTLLMALDSIAGVSRGDSIENISSAPRIWCRKPSSASAGPSRTK